ncbi:MAG: PqqD family protein [Elusimicrobia bacterium]|nr:PqqD family protein [Elusimicrobiota bacterium]
MKEEKKSALIAQAVTWRKTGEEAVILNMETSEYYSANETGTFIWEQLSAGKKPEKIAAALAEEYGIAPALAAEDTAAFLKDLAKLKILAPEAIK